MGNLKEEIKQTRFENNYHIAVVNLMYTNNWVINALNDIFKKFDITYQQYNVLRILNGKHPECCTAGEIKDVMLDKSPDLTRLINRLKIKNFVTGQKNPENKRKVQLAITDAGKELVNQIGPIIFEKNFFMSELSCEEALTLSNLLDKLRPESKK